MNTIDKWNEGLELADKKAEPREDIMLFPFGEFEHPSYGKMVFDNDFFNQIIENYNNNVLSVKPFMDRQHDEDKALAWFDTPPFIRPGIGLFIKPDYTVEGKTILSNRTYRYFSPSWGTYTNPETGKKFDNVLMGGAATNIPFLKTMPPIIDEKSVLDDRGMAKFKLSELTITGSQKEEKTKVDNPSGEQTPESVNKTNKEKIKMNKIIEKFGLSAEASEDDVLAKIDELIAAKDELAGKISEIEKKFEGEKALSDQLSETKKQLNDMSVKLIQKERDEAIGKALSEGKILPADKEYWEKRYMSDPENIKQDLIKMKQVIDFSEQGKSGEGNKHLSDEDPGTKMILEANKIMAEKKCSFDQAVAEVSSAMPELAKAYYAKYKV